MKPKRPSLPHRALHTLRVSLRWRLVALFLLLAVAMTAIFIGGVQRAFSHGWRDAARPLIADYLDRLSADLLAQGQPSIERAQALVQRLPITISIHGPQVNWASGDTRESHRDRHSHGDNSPWQRSLQRTTADGHTLAFGIDEAALSRQPRLAGYTLTGLLLLTLLAFLVVRRLLRPLEGIQAGAQRFGAGDFSAPIPVAHPQRPDELGQLAATINTMGQDISHMLDAKRALLLAISHELRSPLTRARLNTELLPETEALRPQREALLRDLQEMAGLISDVLESERLASRHTALHREPVALEPLARTVLEELRLHHPGAAQVRVQVAANLPTALLDAARMRLLLRNLLDNALRHGGAAATPPQLHLRFVEGGIEIEVRDHGPGVPDDQLAHLAEPFYRPDSARTRMQGGVGLGLYLCQMVALAHGGRIELRNAQPGLSVRAWVAVEPSADPA
jgi:signal transduction histidine kinase